MAMAEAAELQAALEASQVETASVRAKLQAAVCRGNQLHAADSCMITHRLCAEMKEFTAVPSHMMTPKNSFDCFG